MTRISYFATFIYRFATKLHIQPYLGKTEPWYVSGVVYLSKSMSARINGACRVCENWTPPGCEPASMETRSTSNFALTRRLTCIKLDKLHSLSRCFIDSNEALWSPALVLLLCKTKKNSLCQRNRRFVTRVYHSSALHSRYSYSQLCITRRLWFSLYWVNGSPSIR